MTWPEFLNHLSRADAVDIVGPFAMSWSASARPIIFVDRGVRWKRQASAPSIAIGDGDSASGVPMDVALNANKSFSDFAFALRALPQSIRQVHATGFLGGRKDHELANFGEIHDFLKSRLNDATVFVDDQIRGFSSGSHEFIWNGPFSLLALESCEVILTGACKYQISQKTRVMPLSSFTISNEGFGKVSLETTGPIFSFLLTTEQL